MSVPTCKTCEHREGKACAIGGSYCDRARTSPCEPEGKYWTPRRGIVQRIVDWLEGQPQP